MKKITIESIKDSHLKDVFKKTNGADYSLLVELARKTLSGAEIAPDFQKIANAIVAQALLCDSLPPKKKGRPKDGSSVGEAVAGRYFELKDSGVGYSDAVAKVSNEFNKDERHIMRLAKQHIRSIGETKEIRDRYREWWRLCADMKLKAGGKPSLVEEMLIMYQQEAQQAQERDLWGELDTMIEDTLARKFSTDIK